MNELDWKASLSDHKDRLAEHLMAFANHPNGGSLVFGVADSGQLVGVDQTAVAQIANTLANLGRDAVEPPLALDHAVVDFKGVSILLVHVPEQGVKPVHRRGKTIEESWVRSVGTTRKASRQEVGALMLNSATPRWEELRASSLLSLDEVLGRWRQQWQPLPLVESGPARIGDQTGNANTCSPFPARHEQVEQDRAPHVQPKPANRPIGFTADLSAKSADR